ncbi:FecR family protein [Pedobacter gandavensis]|uniref:FecR family protein n=1 Tax=Pedobacter gandavensis TaxID=2679963 RepID=UPI00292D7434|nr:FecR domain-containing protein [Pedobacter gandavensis]
MDYKEEQDLIEKYLSGRCTAAEQQQVEDWYVMRAKELEDLFEKPDYGQLNNEIWAGIAMNTSTVVRKVQLLKKLAIAASVVLCLGLAFYFYKQPTLNHSLIITAAKDIAPGGNKAFLTLADGKRISLTDAKDGAIAELSGIKITKTVDGQLIYHVSGVPGKGNPKIEYNLIETPNGGQYQIILPDGTKVWLNAASSLRYPLSFAGLANRKVELLRGEAYFEVSKDKKHPFLVKTEQQEVAVLGTHFNINSYGDDVTGTKTTLLEGLIRISPLDPGGKSALLKPNQQAVLTERVLKVSVADTEQAVAWKNGYFKFQEENIESVMRKIARWYNVKIQYSGKIPTDGLGGTMSREQNLSNVLDMLQATGLVKFKITGNTVIVSQ